MRSTLALLAICATLSAGCSAKAQPDPCAWVRPIRFTQESKAWLLEHQTDMPASLAADLEQVARYNDKVNAICGSE